MLLNRVFLLGRHDTFNDMGLGNRTDVELASTDDPIDTGAEEDGGQDYHYKACQFNSTQREH